MLLTNKYTTTGSQFSWISHNFYGKHARYAYWPTVLKFIHKENRRAHADTASNRRTYVHIHSHFWCVWMCFLCSSSAFSPLPSPCIAISLWRCVFEWTNELSHNQHTYMHEYTRTQAHSCSSDISKLLKDKNQGNVEEEMLQLDATDVLFLFPLQHYFFTGLYIGVWACVYTCVRLCIWYRFNFWPEKAGGLPS